MLAHHVHTAHEGAAYKAIADKILTSFFLVDLCCFPQERLLSRQGQQGWNRLFDLLQAELTARPGDAHVNVKLVQLFCQDGRLDEAVKHCLAAEKRGMLSHSLDWYTVVVRTLQVSMHSNSDRQ